MLLCNCIRTKIEITKFRFTSLKYLQNSRICSFGMTVYGTSKFVLVYSSFHLFSCGSCLWVLCVLISIYPPTIGLYDIYKVGRVTVEPEFKSSKFMWDDIYYC